MQLSCKQNLLRPDMCVVVVQEQCREMSIEKERKGGIKYESFASLASVWFPGFVVWVRGKRLVGPLVSSS